MNEGMNALIFGIFIFLGLPALFFAIPYFLTKGALPGEEGKYGPIGRFLGQHKSLISISLFLAAAIYFATFFFYHLNIDYRSIRSVYFNSLKSDLYLTFAIFSFLMGIALRLYFSVDKEFPERRIGWLAAILLLFFGLGFSTNDIVRELRLPGPLSLTGLVSSKTEYQASKGGVTYYIKLSSSKEEFKVRGDNLSNGYDDIQEHQKAKIWYGKYTREVYSIEGI